MIKRLLTLIESGVIAVASGDLHTCAIKKDGSLWCWGDNYYGQLGYEAERRSKPVYIISLLLKI
jgi:alpha-tubulin suppressor-like RCC1 family protein